MKRRLVTSWVGFTVLSCLCLLLGLSYWGALAVGIAAGMLKALGFQEGLRDGYSEGYGAARVRFTGDYLQGWSDAMEAQR